MSVASSVKARGLGRGPSPVKRAGQAALAFTMAAAGLAVFSVATAPSAAAAPAAECINTIYLTDNTVGSNAVRPVSLSGAVGAPYLSTPQQSVTSGGVTTNGQVNQLGISRNGADAFLTNSLPTPGRIYEYNATPGTITTNTVRPALTGNVPNNIAGAFNPKNGLYYYGGYGTTTGTTGTLVVSAYNPTSNTVISPLVTINVPNTPAGGTNGDFAFSPDGQLYFVASSATVTSLYVVKDLLPPAASTTNLNATRLTETTGLPAATNGIAFASDGYLYLGRATQFTRVNPITGAPTNIGATGSATATFAPTVASTDLGSCANPNTAEISTNVPERVNPTDQFTVNLTGGSYSAPGAQPFGTGTTTGTDTGPQTAPGESAGPGILIPGETYTLTLGGAGTTNTNDYNFSYSCTDQDGTVVKSGSGASTTITPVSGTGSAVDCSFTTAPKTGLAFTKTVNPATFSQAGQTLTYSFSATNNGVTPLNAFTVTDPKNGLSAITCAPVAQGATLPVGTTTTCDATYTTTSADVTSGGPVTNSATATGTTPGGTVVSASSSTFSGNFATPPAPNNGPNDSTGTPFNTPATVAGSSDDTPGSSPIDFATTVLTLVGQPAGSALSNGNKTLTLPDGSVWTANNDGTLTFTPSNTFSGTSTVQYRVTDTSGLTTTGTGSVTVAAGPSAGDDAINNVVQGQTGTVRPLLNDTPGDRANGSAGTLDPNSFQFSNGAQTITVPNVGTYTFNPANGVLTFTGNPAFSGPAPAITYSVADQEGNRASAQISVQVNAVTPTAVDDTDKTALNTSVNVLVLANDLPGDTNVPFVAASLVLLNPDNTTTSTITNASGTYTANANGTVTFDPATDVTGLSTSVRYRITDTNGSTAIANVQVRVGQGAQANDDSTSIPQAQTVFVPILANDVPGDQGDPCTSPGNPAGCDTGTFLNASLTFPANAQPANATVTTTSVSIPNVGNYSLVGGQLRFDPVASYSGTTPAVRYQVTDSYGNVTAADVVIQVRAIVPVATDDFRNTTFNTNVSLPGATNDSPGTDDNGTPGNNADDVTPAIASGLTVFTTGNQPAGSTLSNGNKTLTVTGEGVWTINPDGSIDFNPADDFSSLTSTVTYRIEDAFGTRTTGTAQVLVRPGPSATDNGGTTDQNVDLTVNVVSDDTPGQLANGNAGSFVGGPFFTSADQPAGATVSNGGATLTVPNEGVYTIASNTSITFNPAPVFTGPTSPVTYSITDSVGNTATAQLGPITVNALTPTATDDSVQTTFDTPVTLPGATNDQAANGTTLVIGNTIFPATGQPAGATVFPGGKSLLIEGIGNWDIQANGSVIFTPTGGFSGPTPVVNYRVEDSNGTRDTATLSILVREGPVAGNNNPTIDQNVTTDIPVLNNDTPSELADGSDGDFLENTLVFPAAGQSPNATIDNGGLTLVVAGQGTYTINPADGTVSFDPAPTFSGPADEVLYQVTDSVGNTVQGSINVTVTAVAPTATDDSAATAFNNAVTLQGSANDTAAAGTTINNALTVFPTAGQPATAVVSNNGKTLTQPNVGVWTINGDGTITFTPEAGFSATANAVYTVVDSNGTSDTGALQVLVRTGPSSQPDTANIEQNVNITGSVIANDTPSLNADGSNGNFVISSLTFATPGQPANATVSNNGLTLTLANQGVYTINPVDGQVTFNPETQFTGPTDTVFYSVTDNNGNSVTGSITINVGAVAPIATSDTAVTTFNTNVTLEGATNDTAGSGSAPLVPANTVFPTTGQPGNATVSNNGKTLTVTTQGVYTIQANGSIVFNPENTFSGPTSPVTYRIEDTNGTTATATLSVNVQDGPEADDDTGTTDQNVNVTIDVLDGDTPGLDLNGNPGAWDNSTLVFPTDDQPVGAVVSNGGLTLTVPNEGVYTLDQAAGTVTLDPTANFTGQTSPVTYSITDVYGNPATAQVIVNVGIIAPIAVDDTASTAFNTPVTLPGSTNDTDGSATATIVDADTVFPTAGQVTGATVSPDGKTLTVPNVGVWDINANGTVTFTPSLGSTGTATAVYEVVDTNGTTDQGNLSVTVQTGPSAQPDTANTDQNIDVVIDVLTNDTPGLLANGNVGDWDSSTLLFPNAGQPVGAVVSNGGLTLTVPNEGVYTIDQAAETVTFNPDPQFTDTASTIVYGVADTNGNGVTGSVTVSVGVTTPVATPDSAQTPFQTPVTLEGATNDTPGSTLAPLVPGNTVFPTTGQPTGSVVSPDGKTLTQANAGQWVIQADGSVIFTPADGFASLAQALYQVEDVNGTTAVAGLQVTVQAGPTGVNDTNATPQNVNVTTDVLANDIAGLTANGSAGSFDTASVTFPTTGQPAGAVVSNNGATLTVTGEGVYTVNTDGTITFDPDSDFTGPAAPVTYTAVDSFGNPVTATLTITVAGVDPVATDDSAITPANTPVTLPGILNDSAGSTDAPLVPANTVFPLTGQPAGALVTNNGKTLTLTGQGVWEIQPNGSVIFTPANGFTGDTASVVYQIEDSNGTTDQAELTVTVGSAPKASPDRATTKQNTPVTFSLIGNDEPGTGGTLDPASVVFSTTGIPAGAVVSADRKTLTVPNEGKYVIVDGSVTFTPEPGFTGVGSLLPYSVTDSFGNQAYSDLQVTVTAVKPSAKNDSRTTTPNKAVTIPVLDNDNAGDGVTFVKSTLKLVDPISGDLVTRVEVQGEGVWTVENGQVKFKPANGFEGKTSPIRYYVENSNGDSVEANVVVTVRDLAPNGDGTSTPATGVTPESTPITVNVIDHVFPPNGAEVRNGSLCLVPSSLIANGKKVNANGSDECVKSFAVANVGSWTVNNDGTVTFEPADGFVGNTTVTFQANDSAGNSYENTLSIRVTPDDNGGNTGNDGDDNNDGGLPGTGGAPRALLLLGLALLISGGIVLTRNRLRR